MSARPLRADAERNRQRILAVARDAYAAGGVEVSLDEIARLAGLGVGTVYRRFPTKDALLDALFEEQMTAYAEHTEAARDLAETDPWRAFREHVLFIGSAQACDLGFSDILRDPARGSAEFQALHRRALRASMALVRTAKAAGALRADFRHSDLLLLTNANFGVVSAQPGTATAASRRLVDLMLDAFAAPPHRHPRH
ncbi:MAG: TetR/AcrR family transcriptional regulator [Propioniciclava sp.]